MEITKEIKSKVFAQYCGQMVRFVTNSESGLWKIQGDMLYDFQEGEINIHSARIILRPLSAITKIELLQIAKLYEPTAFDVTFNINTMELTFNFLTKSEIEVKGMIPINDSRKSYQWFIENGFDTEQILLDGKTLTEAELAIYE